MKVRLSCLYGLLLAVSLPGGEALARAGRCNVTIRPASVETAVLQMVEKHRRDCLAKLTNPTSEQQTACHREAQGKADQFRQRNIDRDHKEFVNPNAKDENERGRPRPRGNEQSMSRCGGDRNGQGGRERQTLVQIRQAIQRGEISNGVLSCFCRNDTQAEMRRRNQEAHDARMRAEVDARPALEPYFPPEWRRPATVTALPPNHGHPLLPEGSHFMLFVP